MTSTTIGAIGAVIASMVGLLGGVSAWWTSRASASHTIVDAAQATVTMIHERMAAMSAQLKAIEHELVLERARCDTLAERLATLERRQQRHG